MVGGGNKSTGTAARKGTNETGQSVVAPSKIHDKFDPDEFKGTCTSLSRVYLSKSDQLHDSHTHVGLARVPPKKKES